MPVSVYSSILLLLLAAMLKSMVQMGVALEAEDLEGFSLWTGVAAMIAFLPAVL